MVSHSYLAYLSKLAYEDNVEAIGFICKKIECKDTDTQCFIISNDIEQIVIFRGTEVSINNFKDVKTDLNFKAVDGVHGGFLKSFQAIEKDLIASLDKQKRVTFTGHSLGGALAIISHFLIKDLTSKSCVTFGAPRVFTKETASYFNVFNKGDSSRVVRYENPSDPVPHLPPYMMGYRHIGQVIGDGNWFDLLTTNLKNQIKQHSIDTYLENFKK